MSVVAPLGGSSAAICIASYFRSRLGTASEQGPWRQKAPLFLVLAGTLPALPAMLILPAQFVPTASILTLALAGIVSAIASNTTSRQQSNS